jgi:hypothetical protein
VFDSQSTFPYAILSISITDSRVVHILDRNLADKVTFGVHTRFACLAEMLVRSQSTGTDLLPCRTVSICPLLTNSQFTPYLQYYIQLSSLSYKSLASSHLSISVCSNHAAFIHHPVQRHRLKTIRYSLENHGDVSCVLGGLRWQELEGAGKKSVVGLARKTLWADKWTRMAKLQNSNARVQLSFGLGS